jgi:hypothetical protein
MVMVVMNHVNVVIILFVMQVQQISMIVAFVIKDMQNHFVITVSTHVVRMSIYI